MSGSRNKRGGGGDRSASSSSAGIAGVGADNGGTWLRVAAVDRSGSVLKRIRIPSLGPWQVPAQLKKIFQTWKIARAPHLIVGSKGVWTKTEKLRLARALKPHAEQAAAISDVELAHHCYFKGKPGILLIAGTGSIAYGRNKNRIARAGGLGVKEGDPGSGYWIGRKWLLIDALNGGASGRKKRKLSIRETAALSVPVMRSAERGRILPFFIVQEAADYLAELVWDAARKLDMKGTINLACHGGLFQSPYFLKELKRALPVYFWGRKVRAFIAEGDAALCAARMGLSGDWKLYSGRTNNPPR